MRVKVFNCLIKDSEEKINEWLTTKGSIFSIKFINQCAGREHFIITTIWFELSK